MPPPAYVLHAALGPRAPAASQPPQRPASVAAPELGDTRADFAKRMVKIVPVRTPNRTLVPDDPNSDNDHGEYYPPPVVNRSVSTLDSFTFPPST